MVVKLLLYFSALTGRQLSLCWPLCRTINHVCAGFRGRQTTMFVLSSVPKRLCQNFMWYYLSWLPAYFLHKRLAENNRIMANRHLCKNMGAASHSKSIYCYIVVVDSQSCLCWFPWLTDNHVCAAPVPGWHPCLCGLWPIPCVCTASSPGNMFLFHC